MDAATYGFMVVSLPSEFDGGEIEVTLGPEKDHHKSSEESAWGISMVASYSMLTLFSKSCAVPSRGHFFDIFVFTR